MRAKLMPIILLAIFIVLITGGLLYQQSRRNAPETPSAPVTQPQPLASPAPGPSTLASPMAGPSGAVEAAASGLPKPDLTVDANGLSKATVILTTSQGVIKFKFYPQDAPKTVDRMIELMTTGFYNGLTFHRVLPGFVVQGGDPQGDGAGGSGKKLKAEFNNRRHIEGTVAMARASDPDSADSQFYISLGTHPHLDRSYTVFGMVIEGMDVAKKIKVGDRIISTRIE